MLLEGKKALIMGVANNRSIAWGITQEFKKAGRPSGVQLCGRRH